MISAVLFAKCNWLPSNFKPFTKLDDVHVGYLIYETIHLKYIRPVDFFNAPVDFFNARRACPMHDVHGFDAL